MAQRRRKYRPQPKGQIALTPRDKAILLNVFTHRFLRTQHIIALVSGGRKLADVPCELKGTLIAGPEIVADTTYWKVNYENVSGWVQGSYLTTLNNEQRASLTRDAEMGITVQALKKTYLRERYLPLRLRSVLSLSGPCVVSWGIGWHHCLITFCMRWYSIPTPLLLISSD